MLEWLTKLRKTVYMIFTSLLYKDMIDKGYRLTTRGKRCIEQGVWEGVWGFHALNMQLSLNLHVFTNLETLRTLCVLFLYKDFTT